MQVVCLIGGSGSGKTTVLTALIPEFRARGFTVSSIKHAHHQLSLDQPGKDSFRHAEAGAQEVILASGAGFALFAPGTLPDLDQLLARLSPVDLVLVEGFKHSAALKLEVFRPAAGHAPLWPETDVLGVAADEALPDCPVPVLNLAATAAIADFLIAALRLDRRDGIME